MTVLKSERALQLHSELLADVERQYKALFESLPIDLGYTDRMNVMFALANFKLEQEREAYKTAVDVDLNVAKADVAMKATAYMLHNQGKP